MQFYLLIPILFVLFLKKNIKNFFFIIIILSLILAQFGSSNFPTLTFLVLPTRAWELLMGGLVAFYINNKTLFFTKPLIVEMITLSAFFLIILSVFIFENHTPWPSFYTLLPVVSTCILIFYTNFRTIVSKILTNKLLIFVGLISYSVYLWYYPIYIFIIQYFDLKNFTQKVFFLTFILIISSLTWKYIELPFRKKIFFIKKII
jgi:peptidoglycan/LPS O-acetylase OafA/YrhL